jgi:hypothetical protein
MQSRCWLKSVLQQRGQKRKKLIISGLWKYLCTACSGSIQWVYVFVTAGTPLPAAILSLYFRYPLFVLQETFLRRNPFIRIANSIMKKARFEKLNVQQCVS